MPTIRDEPALELPEVQAGRLPPRYGAPMQTVFLQHLDPLLKSQVSILDAAFDNLRRLLRPGGRMLAQLSGSFSAFALLARLVAHRIRVACTTS